MSMKFRCERDTLVEALSAAGRAVTTRGAPFRCLPASGWSWSAIASP